MDTILDAMNYDFYEKTMKEIYESKTILDGIEDMKNGKTTDGDVAISKIRDKYGLQSKELR